MAKKWIQVLGTKAQDWGVPPAEVTALTTLAASADTILTKAMSSERNQVITAQCKEAFDGLTEKMRFIKNRYFFSPPLEASDFSLLGLQGPDAKPTPIPEPTSQAEGDVSRPGVHLLELRLRPVPGSAPDPHRSDYGYRVYWGVMPPAGATVEAATGPKRELMRSPVSGKELPHSRFTRRKKELFDFDQEDSGKTAYFCVQYENAKGDQGPWGPLFSAVIP
jgi:hypothetical protein